MSKTIIDMVHEDVKEIKEKLDGILINGCSKAGAHDENQRELFGRVIELEKAQAAKDASPASGMIGCVARILDRPWPWLFGAVAVFSPNIINIMNIIKGWKQ